MIDSQTEESVHVSVCACEVASSCPTLCYLWTAAHFSSSVHGDSKGKNTGVGCRASSRESSSPRDGNCISYVLCIGWQVLYHQCHMGTCVSVRNLLEEKQIKVLDSLSITLIRSFIQQMFIDHLLCTPADGEGQGSLACCSPWGHRV